MHLVAALPVQTGCGDEAGPIISRRGQEDEVAGKSLIFFHQDHVSNLRQTHRRFVSTKTKTTPLPVDVESSNTACHLSC